MDVYAYMWATCTHVGTVYFSANRKYVKCDFEGHDCKVYGVPCFFVDDRPLIKEGGRYLISFDPVNSKNVGVFGPPNTKE